MFSIRDYMYFLVPLLHREARLCSNYCNDGSALAAAGEGCLYWQPARQGLNVSLNIGVLESLLTKK